MIRAVSLLVLVALAGCGNKGPLVMADPAGDRAVEAAAAEPATTDPVTTDPASPAPPPSETPATPVPAASTSGTPAR